ncbi:MAG: hypothetical protein RJB01_311 [Actinomycetota bacterium]|jgi:dihydropteroate synthase
MGTRILGVLNVTPDSFSDGGLHEDPTTAIAHGQAMANAGAHIIDVGGESTRPGAQRISVDEELGRVLPVIHGLIAVGIPVSIDTMRAEVARVAVGAGASMVNDVSGGRADSEMYATVAELGCEYIAMHWRAHSNVMDAHAEYVNVAEEVIAELMECTDSARAAGIDPDRIIIDPGLGFAKDVHHNWALLHALPRFIDSGYRVLVGASRKRFLGALLADANKPRDMLGRDTATAVISALAAQQGVWGVRVHDVQSTSDALAVLRAWEGAVDD